MDDYCAVSVETARLVRADLAIVPGRPVPCFPPERGIGGIDPNTIDAASELQQDGTPRRGLVEADDERISDNRAGRKGGEGSAKAQLFGVVASFLIICPFRGDILVSARNDREILTTINVSQSIFIH